MESYITVIAILSIIVVYQFIKSRKSGYKIAYYELKLKLNGYDISHIENKSLWSMLVD
jgi:hypothetical protein